MASSILSPVCKSPYDFQAMLNRLEEISQWLDSLGFSQHNRVRKYARNIEQMLRLDLDCNEEQALAHITEEKRREIFWSYLDADEFVRALDPLRASVDPQSLIPVLKRALDGPPDLHVETPNNSAGRNFMFELVVAGRLARAGYVPSFTQDADLQFSFAGADVGLECKRPFSMKSLETNITAALDQLSKRKAELRIAAISVSRLFNSGNPNDMPHVERHLDAEDYLERRMHGIADQSQQCWYENDLGVGLWFYGFIPISCNEAPQYLMTCYDVICPPRKNELARLLIKCLQQSIPA